MNLDFCNPLITQLKDGVVDKNPKNVAILNAFEEERFLIAQANTEIDEKTR